MRTLHAWMTVVLLVSAGALVGLGTAAGQVPALSTIPVPRPSNLAEFVRDERAAEVLGKALFWDMQVGSDGVQACATCHFHAGADPRTKNQVSPGLLRVKFQSNGDVMADPDHNFSGQGPNYRLRPQDFPLRKLFDPTERDSDVVSDTNNVVSSQGVHHEIFGQDGRPAPDPAGFRIGAGRRGVNVRRVEPRNTPTMINAVFHHRLFWDLRAQNIFNGVNPFGDRDPNAFVYRADTPTSLRRVSVSCDPCALASQAVGPPTNSFEMSADGRPFPAVGRTLTEEIKRRHRFTARRLRNVPALVRQLVHPQDSVLGPFSRWPQRGLNVDYETLIRHAFHPRWWNSSKLIQVAEDGTTTIVDRPDRNQATDEYTLVEYNFSLFFGLAVQIYESTLVSADTPFDRFLRDPARFPLSDAAERGRQVFFNVNPDPAPRGNCRFCHSGALLSEASVEAITAPDGSLIRNSNGQLSDVGTRNIGVRETTEDLGNGGVDPFGASLSVAVRGAAPGSVLAADGTFKIPALRNVELTAPYFHTGGERTLLDVVNFYARGGNHGTDATDKNPIVTRNGTVIGGLSVLNFNTAPDADQVKADLVEFLKALTDERVRRAAAPFDHPQLFVPDGHRGDERAVVSEDGQAADAYLEIPATGRRGGPVRPGFLEEAPRNRRR